MPIKVPPTILLAILVIGFSIFSWTVVSGSEYGFFYGVFQDPPNNGFSAHGPNYYQEHNIWYFAIIALTSVFAVIRIFIPKPERHVGAIFLIPVLIMFWNMTSYKLLVLGLSICCDPYPWLRFATYTDALLGLIIFTIFILEIVSVLMIRRNVVSIG